jgi:hypothetical protein
MTDPVSAAARVAASPTTARARAAASTGASFAEAHAAAVSANDKDTVKSAATTQRVAGHSYMEIISGPRNGMFINNTGNARDGDAFLIVKRNGREFHVYGTGEDRSVYEVRERQKAAAGTTGTGTTGTATTGTTGTTGTGTTGTGTTGTAGTSGTSGTSGTTPTTGTPATT